jgi:hypothetical protein
LFTLRFGSSPDFAVFTNYQRVLAGSSALRLNACHAIVVAHRMRPNHSVKRTPDGASQTLAAHASLLVQQSLGGPLQHHRCSM